MDSYENKEIILSFGNENSIEEVKKQVKKYSNIEICKHEFEDVKRFWIEKTNRLRVKTPIKSLDIMLNGWAIYQTICCRLWARSGFYQSGGAFGFRDQLQDTLGLKYIGPEFMKNQILIHASHQFIEGDVEHWWHKETRKRN